ncbi:hypothetical protein C482_08798 [Natrialba chahannaoensis JCM 10990]|uniref:Uncharacterized protein n=1 Tax=Natrialba chahannaoensis JCM 10990 TaxID=1227492 RepID=M0AQV6_9EURY|nr:DUF6498-containing protein [Natrialba chahannaoensis]ELZ00707.1 hypothetical protein C482_08798 [Natrialba chahannaoensis JCM 10990]
MTDFRRHLLAILWANLIPLAGFVLFDWSTTIFLGVLVLDIWATVFWTLCKMPFAEKRPPMLQQRAGRIFGTLAQKRGGISLLDSLPPIYPRNIPTIFVGFLNSVMLGVLSAVLWVLPYPDLTPTQLGWILLGGLVVFLVRGVDTWRGYFRDRGYEQHSSRTVALDQTQQLLAVGILVVSIVLTAAVTGNTEPPFVGDYTLVTVVFLGKFGADLRAWHISSDPDRRGWFTRIYGSPDTEHLFESVTIPPEDPTVRVRPARPAALADALFHGFLYLFSTVGFLLVLLALTGLFGAPVLTAAGLALLGVFMALRAAVRYLHVGTLEYRCYDDTIVVYDTVLDEPQARLERWSITGVSASPTVVDRIGGTETMTLESRVEQNSPRISAPIGSAEIPAPDPDATHPVTVALVSDAAPVLDALGLGNRL